LQKTGSGNNLDTAGFFSGLIDDVRIHPARCMLSLRSPDFAKVDYVEDCMIDYKELELMASEWLAGGPNLLADVDGDSQVDFKDYAILADMWLDEQM